VSNDRPRSERFDSPDRAAHDAQRSVPDYRAEASVEAAHGFDADRNTSDSAAEQFPWPPAEGASATGAFVQSWQGATFQPATFFRALTERTSLGSALLYYLPLGILIAGAELFWSIVRAPAVEQDSMLSTIATLDAAWNPLVLFLLSPLRLLLELFVSAAVTHAVLKLFGGATRDYGTTARVFAFAYSPMLFGVIPLIGSFVGFIWMVPVAIIGVREAQRTTSGRAAAAVLIPVIAALVLLGLFYLASAAGTLLDTPL
jgi:hypothetical protein